MNYGRDVPSHAQIAALPKNTCHSGRAQRRNGNNVGAVLVSPDGCRQQVMNHTTGGREPLLRAFSSAYRLSAWLLPEYFHGYEFLATLRNRQ